MCDSLLKHRDFRPKPSLARELSYHFHGSSSTFGLYTCLTSISILSLICQGFVHGEEECQWLSVMLLRSSCSDGAQATKILIWCVFVLYISGLQVSAMTTKLHQKLIEDIRLHKRLIALFDEQDKGSKELRGSYQRIELEPHERQSGRMLNEAFRDGDEDKIYILGDRRNSGLERERCSRPKAIEASSSRYELVPYETLENSKLMRPFEVYYPCNDMAENAHHQQKHKVNSINKRDVSNEIAGTRHRNSDRIEDDGKILGGFANPTHNQIRIAKKSHHRHRRSFDLGEVNRQCLSDSDIAHNNNAHQQGRAYLQLAEIPPREAQKLEHILKERSGDGCRNLLKGGMDLEESLRILAKFQKATGSVKGPRQSVDLRELFPHSYEVAARYSFDGRREQQHPRLSLDGREMAKTSTFDLRDAIRSSLNRQKMLYSKKSDVSIPKKDDIRPLDSIRGSNSGDNKKRIPNVVARLMGLEEMPSHSHTNSKPVANKIAVARTDYFTQASRSAEGEATSRKLNPRPHESTPRPISLESRNPSKDSREGQKSYIFMDGEDYHDTIKAALRQIKQQAPPKPSFQEELYLKLNQIHASDRQTSEQEPKTLKQILETMQMKGILHSSPDQANPKVGTDDNVVVRMEEDINVLKPVIEMRKNTRKEKDHHERPLQTLENETPTIRNSGPNPSNKVATSSAPPSIVIIKPVAPQKAQNPTKGTELNPKITSSRHNKLAKNTDAKKKISLSELNRSVEDGESKKKNNRNSSVSDGPPQRPKHRTRSEGLQKQIKPQKPRPSPPSPGLQKKRSERTSKNNKETTSKTPSKNTKTPSKPKISVRSSLARASTDRIPSSIQATDTQSSHGELSQLPIEQSTSSITNAENKIEKIREKTDEIPDVEGIEPASEDENPVSKLSSRTDQHKNNSSKDAVTVSTISPLSVLELAAEADPHEVEEEEEEAGAALTDDEIQEEQEQEEDSSHIKDSDDKAEFFLSSAQQPSNYGDEMKLARPLVDSDEIDCKEYVWQMITKNITLMDDGAEQTELYSRLYHKLQEIEIASFGSLESGKQWHAVESLERRLVLDCVKEVLQRKARLKLQMKEPLLSSGRRKVSLGLKRNSISDLVQELRDDVAELRAYQQVLPSHDDVRNETFGEDFLYGVLQKDLNLGSVGVISIWKPSWDNGMYGEEEAHDCVKDIEKMVFDELLEEIICDFGLG